ncbi:hypothetical protein HDU80_003980, partial [Chytriomyces hyalinus]
ITDSQKSSQASGFVKAEPCWDDESLRLDRRTAPASRDPCTAANRSPVQPLLSVCCAMRSIHQV